MQGVGAESATQSGTVMRVSRAAGSDRSGRVYHSLRQTRQMGSDLGEGARDHVFYFRQVASELLGRAALSVLHPELQTHRLQEQAGGTESPSPSRLSALRPHIHFFHVLCLRAESFVAGGARRAAWRRGAVGGMFVFCSAQEATGYRPTMEAVK